MTIPIALGTLDAVVVVRGQERERRLTMAQLYAPAWEDPGVQHALVPDEMITAIKIPWNRGGPRFSRWPRKRNLTGPW